MLGLLLALGNLVVKRIPEDVRHSLAARPIRSVWHSLRDANMRLGTRKYERFVRSFTSVEAFVAHAEAVNHHGFVQYHRCSPIGRRLIFERLFEDLDLDFRGTSVLDLGPGYGDSLDLARERGARVLEFVDSDDYILAFNVLKGHTGHRFDYTAGRGLLPLQPRQFDVILCKGSVNADDFNRRDGTCIRFPRWLTQLESLAASGCTTVICPTFDHGTRMVGNSYYVCEDPNAFRKSEFSRTLLDRGYEIRVIEGFNDPVERFPFTYVKRSPDRPSPQ